MNDGRIEGAAGELRMLGVLDYRSAPALRRTGQALIREDQGAGLRIDCAGVEKSSSVGLSLLLCFVRDAKNLGRDVSIANLPQDMQQIARVSGLLDVLPLVNDTPGVDRA
ncbi:STAS domain-containing protein [Stutzerimonas nitrititolerans]|uniref:STAS domain-containing protein n=1 Tax=Stutzerimonas nitrititolerans TaxID=2482751 RepID=UPI0028A157A4|nr:STAS domain-containing protein [Stutzerimonas nitrititolerans]